ncbi:MAG: ABC transporter ATP-binding protein [Ruminococcus sp.]|nr:ABC transporter ATP-binding protein [Ruminococcus sp.]
MKDVILELDSVSKAFDGKQVLERLNLEIGRNEFITLLGPSGCGKSTTLRIIGGFEKPDEGRVLFEGKDITGFSPDKRNVNTVFQKYSLFPHMSVEENIAFGLRLKKKSQQYIKDKIRYALKLVNMDGYESRKPDSLSGGQQQRVAIARAIVNEPEILLLDEPLGALDLKLRHGMQRELIKIKREVGITFVYVTHDQEEALTMSDRIVVMNKGIIQQMGTSKSIYDEPQNAFVADFIGDSNIIDGIMKKDCLVQIQNVPIACVDTGFATNELVDVVIRPEDLVIVEEEEGYLKGMVVSIIFKGAFYEIKVRVGHYDWIVQSVNPAQIGSMVGLTILPDNIQIMHKPHSEDAEVVKEDL